jgi:hypothetical protein
MASNPSRACKPAPVSSWRASIARSILLKDAVAETLYPHVLALIGIAMVLVGTMAWRFRKQLG